MVARKSSEQAFSEDAERVRGWVASREGCAPEAVDVQTITYHDDGTIQTATVSIDGGAWRRVTIDRDRQAGSS